MPKKKKQIIIGTTIGHLIAENNKKRLGSPLIVSVKNTTDDKFYDVNIFNPDYDKQDKIKYESCISTVSFGEIIEQIRCGAFRIEKTMIIAICDYHKFKSKQLHSSIIIRQTEASGRETTEPKDVCLDPYQNQDDRAIVDFEFDLTVQTKLTTRYLMPETEVVYRFYPTISYNPSTPLTTKKVPHGQ